jgi:hypothetical protein
MMVNIDLSKLQALVEAAKLTRDRRFGHEYDCSAIPGDDVCNCGLYALREAVDEASRPRCSVCGVPFWARGTTGPSGESNEQPGVCNSCADTPKEQPTLADLTAAATTAEIAWRGAKARADLAAQDARDAREMAEEQQREATQRAMEANQAQDASLKALKALADALPLKKSQE